MAITSSLLINPLATVEQLSTSASNLGGVAVAIEHSVRFEATRLLQAAAILLRLPQEIAAQAIVLLSRFWTGPDGGSMLEHDPKDVAAAALYLATKPSGYSIYPRLLLTVFDYLAQLAPDYASAFTEARSTSSFTDGKYQLARTKLYAIEAHMLRVLGFQTRVTLPQTLCINYLQALDAFNGGEGSALAKEAFKLLNTALFSPQLIYLTHQPNALAVSAIYLAARQIHAKLPETEWWEVFDVDREDLGFLVVALQSVQGFVDAESHRQDTPAALLTIDALRAELSRHTNATET